MIISGDAWAAVLLGEANQQRPPEWARCLRRRERRALSKRAARAAAHQSNSHRTEHCVAAAAQTQRRGYAQPRDDRISRECDRQFGHDRRDRNGDDGMAIVDVPRIAAAIAKQFARKVSDVELIGSTRVYCGRWERFPQPSRPRTRRARRRPRAPASQDWRSPVAGRPRPSDGSKRRRAREDSRLRPSFHQALFIPPVPLTLQSSRGFSPRSGAPKTRISRPCDPDS